MSDAITPRVITPVERLDWVLLQAALLKSSTQRIWFLGIASSQDRRAAAPKPGHHDPVTP